MLEALPIVCPLRSTTGLDCPLCGATRATFALLQGNVAAAFGFNALYVAALPILLALAVWWLRSRRVPAAISGRTARWGALALIGAFFVARNLPWEPFTSLAS